MSEELKRYQFISGNDSTKWRCVPHGKWVLYDDVKSLAASHARLVEALERLATAVFGVGEDSEPDVYADYDKLCELERNTRAALADAKKMQETRHE